MARGRTHKRAGAFAGATISTVYVWEKGTPEQRLLYAVWGAVGGAAGGRLADILDPPTSRYHRALGHSAGGNGFLYLHKRPQQIFKDWIKALERKAAELAKAGNSFLACLCHSLAAFLIGFVAGHASHLILDLKDASGLPILA